MGEDVGDWSAFEASRDDVEGARDATALEAWHRTSKCGHRIWFGCFISP